MKKRIIASILTVMMLMTMLPAASFAEDGIASTATAIYLDQINGDDTKDGLTQATAVKTIEKANELAESNKTNDINLTSLYKVTGTEVWDLGGKTVHRHGLGGFMIELSNANASLTLNNVVLDGAEWDGTATHNVETDSIIKAQHGGTIVLNSGAILQNNKAAQFGSGIFANNGAKITMADGAVIRNNTNRNYELGGGVFIGNGSTFLMNGGEISGNTANGGGGVAIIGSSMTMNDGLIANNSVYKTSGQGSYGAGVYVADYANASGGDTLFTAQPASFEINGGKITGNKALDYGGGILTFPQRGKTVTVCINDGEISKNQVNQGSGGAIAAFFGNTKLDIKGGKLTKNSAKNYGGGVFLYQATKVNISGGTISENKASDGGGVCLYASSAVKQTAGAIKNNVANRGGGVFDGTYTMTGGVIKDNNNSLTEDARRSTQGDGVFVGTAFNLGNDAVIDTNNDVYLKAGTSVSKEGRYINVIAPYNGAGTTTPIQITSEDTTIEATEVGTQLVHYTADAGGDTAAAQADADGIFVPSWKMSDGLVIGQSHAVGKTDWMTYVPSVKVNYEWVSMEHPSDVTPPADDFIRSGTAYTAKEQKATQEAYNFEGWFTDEQCTVPYTNGTVLNADITLYGKWVATQGNLTVSKTVAGTAGDIDKAFNFTVKLGNDSVNGQFGEMTFTNGKATFALKHGESLTATGLPTGISYEVTETEANKDGYTTTSENANGSILKDVTAMVAFTNIKNSSGGGQTPHPGSHKVILHYESNGGTHFDDELYTKGTIVQLDKRPTREGYRFTGWYADKELTKKITEIKMTSDKTVYAGWVATTVPDLLNGSDHQLYIVGYPDGLVRPLGPVYRSEVAAIFYRLLKPEVRKANEAHVSGFSDVSTDAWYGVPVATLEKMGIISGRTKTTFDPNGELTRAEFAVICARFDTGKTDGYSNFTDIAGHWAEKDIKRAAALGWVQGTPDGRFLPDEKITRAEAMTLINRVLCRIPESESDLMKDMIVWPDNTPDKWYYLPVQEATNSHTWKAKDDAHETWTGKAEDPDWYVKKK